jgi:hypothetical protein
MEHQSATLESLEKIFFKEELIAQIIRTQFQPLKTTFFSDTEYSQQLGLIVYGKNGTIKPHRHKPLERSIHITQEVLVIRQGRVIVDFYTDDKTFITHRELGTGDILFLCSGAHGFRFLEDTQMIEIKQGPYSGKENDKEEFDPVVLG